jgi:hypothetical protein
MIHFFSDLFESYEDLLDANVFGLSDTPDVTSSQTPTIIGPMFPTDGCYTWESQSSYNQRVRGAVLDTGNTNIPRECLDKAILILSGANFGVNYLNQEGVLRVTFVNPVTLQEFEASTTSSEGNHEEICTVAEGCEQDHTQIKVWVPYGSGLGLLVKIEIGNQVAYGNFTVNYLPPVISSMAPGSIFTKGAFQDADGDDLGWTGSTVSVLINGKTCTGQTWIAGSDGTANIQCEAQQDTVGPKSVMVCVANQTYVSKIFKTDPAVLAAGDALGVWIDGTDSAQTDATGFASHVFSYTVTRCGANRYGRLYELCSDCPDGADCGTGSFNPPVAQSGYFGYELDRTTDAAEALSRCGSGTYLNASDANDYPDAVVQSSCLNFVACDPAEACLGANQCSVGYQYAQLACDKIRYQVGNGTTFVSSTGDVISTNECSVYLDPYTGQYTGTDSDCRGNVSTSDECDWTRPWECSTCELVYSETGAGGQNNSYYVNSGVPKGVCTCQPSTRCALCTIQTYYRLNNQCTVCPANVALLISVFFIGAFVACAAAYYLSKRKVNLAFMAIAVDYFQVLAVFANTDIVWPAGILAIFQFLSLFNFNIDIAAPECLVPSFPYQYKFYGTLFLPLAALAVLLGIHLSYTAYKIYRDGRRVNMSSHVSKLISVFLQPFHLMVILILISPLWIVMVEDYVDVMNLVEFKRVWFHQLISSSSFIVLDFPCSCSLLFLGIEHL